MLKRLICVAVVVGAAFGGALSQEVVDIGDNLVRVTVAGQGMSKDDSVREALRQAVERGAGTFIHSQSETEDFALVRDTVLVRSTGFIQSHDVVSQKELIDGTWETTVRAVVSIQGIEDAWGVVTTMLQRVGRPKVMVFVREKIGDEFIEDSTVQARIENLLLNSGFGLVDKNQIKAIEEKDLAAAVAEDSPARLQAIAKSFGAQLFISGSANAAAGPVRNIAGTTLFPYEAEANIKCYRSDTGQLLSSIPGDPTRGVDRVARSSAKKALDLQARQIAPKVQMDILRFWQDALAGRGEVKLVVDEIAFGDYMKLRKALGDLENVKDIGQPKYANKVAEFSLQTDLQADPLAVKIYEAIGEQLEISDISQNVIKARFAGGS